MKATPVSGTPDEIFERMVTDHATSHGIAPDRILWEQIECPKIGTFIIPIKDHESMTMEIL